MKVPVYAFRLFLHAVLDQTAFTSYLKKNYYYHNVLQENGHYPTL